MLTTIKFVFIISLAIEENFSFSVDFLSAGCLFGTFVLVKGALCCVLIHFLQVDIFVVHTQMCWQHLQLLWGLSS